MRGDARDIATLLDDGLPTLPTVLSAQDEVPAAVWRQGRLGAVLWIMYDPEDDHGPYLQDIEIRFREADGSWTCLSTAGSDWPARYGERPDGTPVLTFAAGATNPEDGHHFLIASGVAPPGVRKVGLEGAGDDEVSEVEPVTGAFLLRAEEDALGSYTAVLDASSRRDR